MKRAGPGWSQKWLDRLCCSGAGCGLASFDSRNTPALLPAAFFNWRVRFPLTAPPLLSLLLPSHSTDSRLRIHSSSPTSSPRPNADGPRRTTASEYPSFTAPPAMAPASSNLGPSYARGGQQPYLGRSQSGETSSSGGASSGVNARLASSEESGVQRGELGGAYGPYAVSPGRAASL